MVGKGHININVMDNLETLTKLSIQDTGQTNETILRSDVILYIRFSVIYRRSYGV